MVVVRLANCVVGAHGRTAVDVKQRAGGRLISRAACSDVRSCRAALAQVSAQGQCLAVDFHRDLARIEVLLGNDTGCRSGHMVPMAASIHRATLFGTTYQRLTSDLPEGYRDRRKQLVERSSQPR